jgi:hypothetical protein
MSETSRHHRSVSVPAAQAAAVLEALLTTYAVKADALAAAAGTEPLTVVHDARRELAEAEDALDAIAWQAAPELCGAAGLVREVLYGALLGAVEACAERCVEYEAGVVGRDGLAAAVGDVVALHALFAEIEALEAL